MKAVILIAPLALLTGACASEDLAAFAVGMNQVAYELDNQLNPPCPQGMYRQFVADTLVPGYPSYSYPAYGYGQVGYQITPGGYSYCTYPVLSTYYYDRDDEDDHERRHDHGHGDKDYSKGYRDGYRDGQRDD